MLISTEKMLEWAKKVEAPAGPAIVKFITEAEILGNTEIEASKACLLQYGYKVYENPYHMQEA